MPGTNSNSSSSRNCPTCQLKVASAAKKAYCGVCKATFHAACAQRETILANGSYATCCKSTDSTPQRQQTQLSNQNTNRGVNRNDATLTIDIFQKGLDELFEKVKLEMPVMITEALKPVQQQLDKVEEILQNHESRITDIEAGSSIATQDRAGLEKIYQELGERARRASNVIVFNFSENTDSRDDLPKINGVLEEAGELPQAHHCIRLGKLSSEKIRPLKLFFSDEKEAHLVLRNKRSLDKYKLTAKLDETLEQRKYRQLVRQELMRRTEAGEEHLTIKYISGIPSIVVKEN